MKNTKYLAILLAVGMLCGCGADASTVAYESEPSTESVVEESLDVEEQSSLEESEESCELDEESEEEVIEEPVTIEYVEWDGTGIIKKSGEAQLSDRQYFNGKTYVVDTDGYNLGAEIPVVPRQEGDQLVEPVIGKFLLTEDKLFYMEENPDVETSGWTRKCYDLYVQFLESGEVEKLATKVGGAVYQEDVITCRKYIDVSLPREEQQSIVQQIDVNTGKILYEQNLGAKGLAWYFNKDYIYYDKDDKSYCYNVASDTTGEVLFYEGTRNSLECFDGNIYAELDLENGNTKIVQLYEQGEPVYRIFPKEFSSYTYCSHDKVFYQENRKIMQYNLETGEDIYICDLSENEYGPCQLLGIEENGGIVLIEEHGAGGASPGDYGVRYLYEVKDGVKTLVTDGFWIYG